MIDALKKNPVRVYAFVSTLVAAVVVLIPGFPAGAVLAVLAGFLGLGGEMTRARVTPVDEANA